MKIVIMAGGKGTRIASVSSEVPKPMIPIDGKPILEYQLECLRKQGLKDIILVIGHLGKVIQDYFGDGKEFGVDIEYIFETTPLGTAGALYYLKDKIRDDFFLLNGDIIFDVDLRRMSQSHRSNPGIATIMTHPNSHPYDSGIVITNEGGRVIKWLTKEEERTWYKNRVNAGIHILSPTVLEHFNQPEKKDLDRDILKPLIEEKKLYIYQSPEYIKDMGTPDRFFSVTEDIRSGLVERKNLKNKQKAIFMDRDGTINEYVGFLRNIDDMCLVEGAAEAINLVNQSGYLAIVITNQPVVARGEVSFEELDEIHNKMETLLGNEGAYIDDIFYCPHHPHKGFEGERPELKFDCNCRKPKPGMLLQAASKYNIALSESWMIGDSTSDVEAGMQAGCKTMLIGDLDYKNLLECVKKILERDE